VRRISRAHGGGEDIETHSAAARAIETPYPFNATRAQCGTLNMTAVKKDGAGAVLRCSACAPVLRWQQRIKAGVAVNIMLKQRVEVYSR